MQRDRSFNELSFKQAWLRRILYLFLIIVVIFLTPIILDNVGYLVAGGDWTEFKETLFSQSGAAQTFLTGFAVTIIIIAVMMYLVLSAFDTTEGGW
ncbi:MAG: hypothetical protein ACFFED_01830 [Candidatus Thorarchaeota archaeon]